MHDLKRLLFEEKRSLFFFNMMKNYRTMKKISLIIFVFALIFTAGCKYDFIVEEEIPVDGGGGGGGGGTTDISFAQTIEPIFNNGNNCTACHKTGGTKPDLSTGKAYTSISNAAYINSATPESSKIYSVVEPGSSTHMHKKYTAAQAANVLNWIKQGAKNN